MKNLICAMVVIASGNFAHAEMSAAAQGCAIGGPEDAPVTIEEFVDLDCGYCAQGSKTIQKIAKNYGGKVRLVVRNFPLPSHQPASMIAAQALTAVCLQSPQLADAFQRELFEHQDQLIQEGEPFLFETASKLGVNVSAMKSDMQSKAVAAMIANDQQLANSYGFKGTPSYVIGAEPLTGARPYAEIKAIVDRQLAP